MTKTNAFTGKAQAYADARPGYPDEVIIFIRSIAPANPVFADIGAGTGKFTELLARSGHKIHAVEPNDDMRKQLAVTMLPFPNVSIIDSTAEETTLPDNSVDIIICSQSLGWFDLKAFRTECNRIGKRDGSIISLFNHTPGDQPVLCSHRYTNEQASKIFFINPTIHEFPNPVYYTREKWLQLETSISDSPKPDTPEYDSYIAKINAEFDNANIDGILCCNFITKMYHENISDFLES